MTKRRKTNIIYAVCKQNQRINWEEKIMSNTKFVITSKNKSASTQHPSKRKTLEHWKIVAFLLIIYDIIVINGAYFLALCLRFDFRLSSIPAEYFNSWLKFIPIYSVICLALFWLFHLYKSIWRFASLAELFSVFVASVTASVMHSLLITIIFQRMPISYYLVGAGIQLVLLSAVRFSYRFVLSGRERIAKKSEATGGNRVMLIGAGAAGRMILRDLQQAEGSKDHVCCIIDDNSNKWGRYIDNIPIVGGRDDILLNAEKYKIEKIFVAIPSASASVRRDILNICKETGCELKNLPGLYQIANGEVNVSNLKNVDIEDLLGREPIQVNMDEIYGFLNNKVILVTGGGGSIGSELCRQIAKHHPKQLIIFDVYENNAHAIRLELEDNFPDLNLVVLIGSVRDSSRLNYVFKTYKPDVVYHAAAHKHVPLMEGSPCEAIKNNTIGTYKTAYAAMLNGCRRFVLISTDKAVNPTNIMGASKRLCEMVIQTFDRKIREGRAGDLPMLHIRGSDIEEDMGHEKLPEKICTEFVAVRFGNVLGSNGSVIPRFKEQIARGGPVTVTHPDIIRYFMTIPEAASLVLQAGTYAKGGEIFVLDMGSPMKIDTLARNMIKLSGLKPDEDIKIEYTGLRPGEKLYEEKLMAEEGMQTTPNKLIHIGHPLPFDEDLFLQQLQRLMYDAYEEQVDDIREVVKKIVPTYQPAGEHGSEKKGATYEKEIQYMQRKNSEVKS